MPTQLTLPVLALLLIGVWISSRKTAAILIVIGTLFLTQNHLIQIGTFSLFPNRLLSYVGFFRVLFKKEFRRTQLNKVDGAFILLYVYTTLILLTRPEESFALRMAKMADVLFGYFAFRGLIQSPDDLRHLLKYVALLLGPYVLLLLFEMRTSQNLFFPGGAGVRQWVREGRFRCFGSFRHPSLLGSLGATFWPLYFAWAWMREYRRMAILGMVLCLGVVMFSNSGGPVSAFAAGVAGWLLWRMRTRMRTVRWLLLALLVFFDIFMKAPIWYVLMRISAITGGTGWHRAYLIEVALKHLGEWWLVGMPILETQDWFYHTIKSSSGADITNQFISFGLSAGVVSIGLFIFFIVRSFSYLGSSLAALRADPSAPLHEQAFLWGLGCMLAVHLSNWLGITYFDQFVTLWVLQSAALCSVSQFWLQQYGREPREVAQTGNEGLFDAGLEPMRQESLIRHDIC